MDMEHVREWDLLLLERQEQESFELMKWKDLDREGLFSGVRPQRNLVTMANLGLADLSHGDLGDMLQWNRSPVAGVEACTGGGSGSREG